MRHNVSKFFLLASLLAASVVPTPVVAAPKGLEPTVYVTRTGSKYHNDGCRYLKKSKIAVTLSEAKRLGNTACSVCRPPSSK
jgi:hypothetical protein